MKAHTTISIDVGLKNRAKRLGINISKAIEDVLYNIIAKEELKDTGFQELQDKLDSAVKNEEKLRVKYLDANTDVVALQQMVDSKFEELKIFQEVKFKDAQQEGEAVRRSGIMKVVADEVFSK
jgi:hypothetical protein